AAIAADVERIGEAFRAQTGVIEERTRTMQNALSVGVENVRKVLENSAVVIAGSLREKVMEVTAALSEEAQKTIDQADERIADSVARAAERFGARVNEIDETFDGAAERIGLRADAFAQRFDDIDRSEERRVGKE